MAAKTPSPLKGWLGVIIAGFIIFAITRAILPPTDAAHAVAYSTFKKMVANGEVARVVMSDGRIDASGDDDAAQPMRLRTQAPGIGDAGLLPLLEAHDVEIVNQAPKGTSPLWGLLPWLLILGFWFYLARRTQGGGPGGIAGGPLKEFLNPKSRRKSETRETTRFKDVAGQENAKREVAELVEFLRDPERFAAVGAQVPRGVLLLGPPGVGKTLLARALAGEADVPFFSTSASEFIEVFVGVGAARVRSMFEEAKQQAPSIVFIDELDSVGRARGAGYGGGHDEREQTLNQILAELDGFTGREAVVVLAATNRPDVLDPALLRPGRFDRHVELNLPTLDDRVAILAVHTTKVPVASDVDLHKIAAGIPGFSGADIKNLVNEAAISAARVRGREVRMEHFETARDKIVMGTVRTLAIQPEERHRLAVHEAGHAAAAFYQPEADPLYKVTIIPRGRSLGATHFLPEEERHTLPAAYLHAQLATSLAGRAAEKIFLGGVSSGADDDIKHATRLARAMVARWGMSDDIGPVDLRASDEHPFLGRDLALPRAFADATAAKVDVAVADLLRAAEVEAVRLIEDHRAAIERLILRLEAEESLSLPDIKACLAPASASGRQLTSPAGGANPRA